MKKIVSSRDWLCSVCLLVCLGCFGAAQRVAGADADEAPGRWDIRVGVPVWGAGLDGDLGIEDREAVVDEDFTDITDYWDFAAGLNLEVRKSRWLFFTEGLYFKTSADAEPGGLLGGLIDEVELTQKHVIGNFGLGFEVVRTKPFSLELFGGGRVQYVDAEIAVDLPGSEPSFSDSTTWADPVVGANAELRLLRSLALFTKADVGGFDVSSDLTWQVNAGVQWDIARHLYLRASYRHLSTEFEDDGFTFDLDQSGPQLELGLRF